MISCIKKQSASTEYIPSTLKDYSIFQLGSYWLYKNEITGNYDSTYIADGLSFTYNHEGDNDYSSILECCTIHYSGSFLQETYVTPTAYTLFFKGLQLEAIDPSSFFPNHVFEIDPETNLTNISTLDSMTIYNNKFYAVFITKWQRIRSYTDTLRCISYFVKKIGLVRFERYENRTDTIWNLMNYHIIP
jgi:hypothetical protein